MPPHHYNSDVGLSYHFTLILFAWLFYSSGLCFVKSNECAKIIVQADIAEVIYMDEPVVEDESIHASRILLQLAGVKIRKFHTDRRFLALDFWQALNSAEREVQKKG